MQDVSIVNICYKTFFKIKQLYELKDQTTYSQETIYLGKIFIKQDQTIQATELKNKCVAYQYKCYHLDKSSPRGEDKKVSMNI